MSLALSQSVTAVGPGITAGFLGVGGVAPYSYAVQPGGAGGFIDSVTGLYTAPAVVNFAAAKSTDMIVVTDSLSAQASSTILVGSVLELFCDILQHELGLANDHIYLYNQKIFQPTDSSMYIAVGVLNAKPFGNVVENDGAGSGFRAKQYCNMKASLDINVISRSTEALLRKEEVIMALKSNYAAQQMDANSFSIGQLPVNFANVSGIDGAAIPYRFTITVNIQYTMPKTVSVPYYDTFAAASVTTNP